MLLLLLSMPLRAGRSRSLPSTGAHRCGSRLSSVARGCRNVRSVWQAASGDHSPLPSQLHVPSQRAWSRDSCSMDRFVLPKLLAAAYRRISIAASKGAYVVARNIDRLVRRQMGRVEHDQQSAHHLRSPSASLSPSSGPMDASSSASPSGSVLTQV